MLFRSRCQIFRTDTFIKQAETGTQPGMRFLAFSPDGKFLASGAFHYPNVKIWNAQTGQLVKELPAANEFSDPNASVVFSADGRELVISTPCESLFWKTSDWALARRRPRPPKDLAATMSFSSDGKLFAATQTRNVVRLYDAVTGTVLADLEAPHSGWISALSFNHDATQLAVGESRDALRVWDLRQIREQLADMGLDWDQPPRPSGNPGANAAPVSAKAGIATGDSSPHLPR